MALMQLFAKCDLGCVREMREDRRQSLLVAIGGVAQNVIEYPRSPGYIPWYKGSAWSGYIMDRRNMEGRTWKEGQVEVRTGKVDEDGRKNDT